MVQTHAFGSDRAAELVTMFEDAILDVRHLSPGACFTLGDGEADLPYAIDRTIEIVRHRVGGGIELVDAIGMDVELIGAGMPLVWTREVGGRDGDRRVAILPAGGRARIALGDVSVLVEDAAAPRRAPLTPRTDLRQHASTLVSAIACLLFILGIRAIPPGAGSLEIDPFLLGQRSARFSFVAPTPPPQPQGAMGANAGGAGAAPSAEQRKPASPRVARIALSRAPSSNPRSTSPGNVQAQAQQAASAAGILGVLRTSEGTHAGMLFKNGGALGDAQETMGTLTGSPVGDSLDGGGLGLVRGGRGPGGDGLGTIGMGRFSMGTCGKNCTGDEGRFWGQGGCSHLPFTRGGCAGAQLHGRRASAPEVEMKGEVRVTEGRDREIIRRVVRHHAAAIRFCYEQELQHTPSLDGRVVTKFIVAVDGRVNAATTESSTMHAPKVEACIADGFRRMDFGKAPPGAGIAIVSYPFGFRQAGQ